MKAILIDDEPLALDFLEAQIQKLNRVEIVGKFTFFLAEEQKDLLGTIDLVFLDIEIPEINGLQLAEKIIEINSDIEIIFVTAYNEYAVQAFELNALDYLLKPVTIERLKNTFQRIKKYHVEHPEIANEQDQLFIQLGRELTFSIKDDRLDVNWRTAKTKELFLYLLHNRGETVRKDFLADYFWPTLEMERANSQMYTTIYHIRRALRPLKNYISVESNQEGYILVLNDVKLDLYEWEKSIKTMPKLHADSVNDYEKMMQHYSGSYLGSADYLWAEAERYRLEELWLKVAYKIADYHFKLGETSAAKEWYDGIIQAREDEEKAHFQLMKLYAMKGQIRLVKKHYQQLINIYDELKLPMNEEVTSWYEEWRNQSFGNIEI